MTDRVAIDIGGTFTDLVVENAVGTLTTTKVLSTPLNLVDGVLAALAVSDVPIDSIEVFVHGTTQSLNALLERRGARVALITTQGFGDTYVMGRGHRPDMYNLHYHKPVPLLDRSAIFEVQERLSGTGEVLGALDAASVRVAANAIADGGYEVVALCLLHSYANSAHEVDVETILRERLPGLPVVSSHRAAPEWREYERVSTTVMSAYITPIMRGYLEHLESRLRAEGLAVPLYINESNGGMMTANLAVDHAIGTLMSGPVGGVIGTAALSEIVGDGKLIAADVGGTSFDVSIVKDGKPTRFGEFEIQGLPVLAPAVEVHTIGAGGGSLIDIDLSGRLKVGPESAGAVPGPAAYGNGGTTPTVTDAHVVLGRLPAVQKMAGTIELDAAAAASAMSSTAAKLGLDEIELATQALEILNFRMAEAIRELTIERGLDPRTFILCFFGGAGGLHAIDVATELGISRVIIPALPGSFSASGMLRGNIQHDLVQSFFRSRRRAEAELTGQIDDLTDRAAQVLQKEGIEPTDALFEYLVDMRYVGQEYTMSITYPRGGNMADLINSFHASYRERYSHSSESAEVEFVALRVTVSASFGRSRVVEGTTVTGVRTDERDTSRLGSQTVYFNGQPVTVPVVRRNDVISLDGPALILEATCTTAIPPGWHVSLMDGGHLMLEREAES